MRWGTALHDRFMLPHFLWEDFLGVLDELKRSGYDFVAGMVRGAARIPLSRVRPRPSRRRRAGTAAGAGALACAGRGGLGRRHRALCRFLGRAAAGQGDGFVEGRHVVTCNGRRLPMTGDRPLRRGGRRRPLQGLAAGLRPAPDHSGACAADLRPDRHLERPLARRLRLSRRPSRRPQLRDQAGQFLRGRGAAAGPLPGPRPHPRQDRSAAGGTHASNSL